MAVANLIFLLGSILQMLLSGQFLLMSAFLVLPCVPLNVRTCFSDTTRYNSISTLCQKSNYKSIDRENVSGQVLFFSAKNWYFGVNFLPGNAIYSPVQKPPFSLNLKPPSTAVCPECASAFIRTTVFCSHSLDVSKWCWFYFSSLTAYFGAPSISSENIGESDTLLLEYLNSILGRGLFSSALIGLS